MKPMLLDIIVSSRSRKWAFGGGIVLLALLLFYPLLIPNQCLFTTDDNMSIMSSAREALMSQFKGQWVDRWLYGMYGSMGQISWTTVMLGIFPIAFVFNWIHAADLVLASIFLWLFLRKNNLSRPAIALGILTAYWLGTNLTLTYAGHLAKFSILMMAPLVLVCIKQVKDDSCDWFWCIISGGIMGLMFIEQQDVALFFNMFLGLYAVFHFSRVYLIFNLAMPCANPAVRKIHSGIIRVILLLAIIPFVALLVSSPTLLGAYTSQVKSMPQCDKIDDRQAKWEFTTQWSWPPEESIDFIAPGYMGWRSGEPEGPYWGRMGRSAGWEKTGQGFMNFKLENQYIGVIPLIFAIFAFLVAIVQNYGGTRSCPDTPILPCSTASTRAEVYFWFFAAVLALLLSFGKYFPLYQLFYQLPVVRDIRNPNKFLQIFQLALGILTAYGAHFVFNWHQEGATAQSGKGRKSA